MPLTTVLKNHWKYFRKIVEPLKLSFLTFREQVRGHSYMTFHKFEDFLTPLSLLLCDVIYEWPPEEWTYPDPVFPGYKVEKLCQTAWYYKIPQSGQTDWCDFFSSNLFLINDWTQCFDAGKLKFTPFKYLSRTFKSGLVVCQSQAMNVNIF